MQTSGLDITDLRILACLRNDGRISNQDLAERVSLSPSACLRRLRLLEQRGVIGGYRAWFSGEAMGVEVEAIVHVSMRQDTPDWHERFFDALAEWPEVKAAYVVTGESNYVLHVQAGDLKHYSAFIVDELYRAAGVMNIRSNLVLRKVKEGGSPLDLLHHAGGSRPVGP